MAKLYSQDRNGYKWHVLYVAGKKEKYVYSELCKMNITAFLPLETVVRQRSDRKKKLKLPLFPSYVFVNSSINEYLQILNINGVLKFVSFRNKLAVIPDHQINSLIKIDQSNIPFEVNKESFKKGDKVKIVEGPLLGCYGHLIHDSKKSLRLTIQIANIGYSLIIKSPHFGITLQN